MQKWTNPQLILLLPDQPCNDSGTSRGLHLRTALKWLSVVLGLVACTLAALIWWPPASAPLPTPEHDRLIVNVRVVDVERGTASKLTSVLVRDGRITAIGERVGDPKVPILDGRGGYLTPGFWDMHVHTFQLSPQLHLPLFVANGVTGVRDMMDCPGDRDALIACVRDKREWANEVDRGELTAPRIVKVASFYFDRSEMLPDEAARLAPTYRSRGIDEIKVYNRLSRPTYLQLTREAQRLEMRVVGHLPKAVSLDDAIAAGQASFEHAHLFVRHCFTHAGAWRAGALDHANPTRVVESMVRQREPAACARSFAKMRAAGTWLVPTHVTREEDARASEPAFVADPRLGYLDPLSRWAYRDDLTATTSQYPGARGRAALQAYFDLGLRLTGEAYRSGVPVLVGTDTAIGGFRYHDEMALLVRAGLSPAEVLKAATIDAARYAGAEGSYGTVAVGKTADLVLLDANPLTDIGNAQRVRAVLLGGRLYDRNRLDELLAFVRRQGNAPTNWAKLLWGFATSSVRSEL